MTVAGDAPANRACRLAQSHGRGAASITILFVSLGFSGIGADTNTISFTNKQGILLSNAVVVKVEPDGLLYNFQDMVGGGKAKFVDLPESIRTKYGYDPKAAAEFEKKKLAAEQAYRGRQALLLQQQKEAERQKLLLDWDRNEYKPLAVRGTITQKHDGMVFIDLLEKPSDPLAEAGRINGFRVIKRTVVLRDHPNYDEINVGEGIKVTCYKPEALYVTNLVGDRIVFDSYTTKLPAHLQEKTK